MPNPLHDLISQNRLVQAPGAYDGLTARLIERAGYPAVYMTGYGTAASFGFADQGHIGRDEMLANVQRIAAAIEIPLIADADTGYGGPDRVFETVRLYEDAGAAAIQLEDQQWPKRCGHMTGKSLVTREEMIEKIRAAKSASRDIMIVGRTDAIAVEGFESAIARAAAYADAGADILFVEAPTSAEQMRHIIERLQGVPQLANLAPKTPSFSADELQEMGFAIAIYPGICFMSQWQGALRDLESLRRTGIQDSLSDWRREFSTINEFLENKPEAPASEPPPQAQTASE